MRPTVKIGLVAPFEGRYRYVGYDVIYAARLAVREVNTAGGVGGYAVELIAYDDGADDTTAAVEQARKLAVDPEVVAVVGHFRDETTAAALPIYAEAGIPLVSPAVVDPELDWGEGLVYHLGATASAVADALLQHIESLGQGRAALVTDGGPLGEAIRREAQARGVRVEPVVSTNDPDWLSKVLSSGVEVVLCDAGPVEAGEAVALLRNGSLNAGWGGVFLGGPELAAADFAAVAGQAAEGAEFVTPWPFPADVPGSEPFVAAYQGVSPHVPPPGPLALPAHEATQALLVALERAIATDGRPTRAGVVQALTGVTWGHAPLYWYRIGADGIPERVEAEIQVVADSKDR